MEFNWLARFPEAWRLWRSGVRPAGPRMAVIVSTTVSLLIAIVIGSIYYLDSRKGATIDPKKFFTVLTWAYVIYHLALLWLLAPGMVSVSMLNEWKMDTWVFQQTTPQSGMRLALGKLIGAPASVYLAFLVSIPYLLLSAFPAGVLLHNVLIAYLIIIAVSACLSGLGLYAAVMLDKQKARSQGVSAMVGAPAILVFVALAVSAPYFDQLDTAGMFFGASPYNLSPFAIFFFLFRDLDLAVPFFWTHFPAWLLTPLLYGAGAYWLAVAAAGQLSFKMSIVESRLPLLLPFLLAFILLAGLTSYNYLGPSFNPAGDGEMVVNIYFVVMAVMLYYTLVVQTRNLVETRPWLYHYRERPEGPRYYFRSDAPSVFTMGLLLAVMWLGWAALIAIYPGALFGGAGGAFLSFFMLTVVVVRDALFLQLFRLRPGKEKPGLIVLTYFLAFFTGPMLLNAIVEGVRFDFSMFMIFPSSPLFEEPIAALISLIVDVAMLCVLLIMARRRIIAALKNLPPEIGNRREA